MAAKEEAQIQEPLYTGEGDEHLVDDHRGGAEGHYGGVLTEQFRSCMDEGAYIL